MGGLSIKQKTITFSTLHTIYRQKNIVLSGLTSIMKKQLLTLCFILFSVTAAFAQPTITAANFPFAAKVQYQRADSSTVPGLTTTNSSFWDLGSIQKKGGYETFYYEQVSNDPVFTTANEKSQEIVTFGPLEFNQNVYAEKSTAGYVSLGIGYERQIQGIGNLSGNNGDSVEIIAQKYVFGVPFTDVSFPLTTSTKWVAATKAVTDMRFTVTLAGYNRTPAQLINYFTADNEVLAHGTCRVPAKGSPGQTFPVLMVKVENVRIDSFYIDGMPANPFILAAIGVSQGDTVRSYEYHFYRENAGLQQLAKIEFEDNSYTTVKGAQYSSEFDVLSVGDLSINNGVLVYPNPILNNTFTVRTTTKSADFSVTNITGQRIKASVEVGGNDTYQITLPENLAKGVYFLHTPNNTKNAAIKLLVK